MIGKAILKEEEILAGAVNHKERLAKEQLLSGAAEAFMLNEGSYVSLWRQNPEIDLYSTAGHYQGDFFWIQYACLTHARKLYKKVQTIIKRQKKAIKDILKLDECCNFHKEIS